MHFPVKHFFLAANFLIVAFLMSACGEGGVGLRPLDSNQAQLEGVYAFAENSCADKVDPQHSVDLKDQVSFSKGNFSFHFTSDEGCSATGNYKISELKKNSFDSQYRSHAVAGTCSDEAKLQVENFISQPKSQKMARSYTLRENSIRLDHTGEWGNRVCNWYVKLN